MPNILTYFTLGVILLFSPASAITKSPGCGKSLASEIKTGGTGSSNRLRLTSNGIKRTYLLHLPKAYSPTRAHGLIFSFHGRSATARNQERLSKFSESEVNRHMLAVYPEGIHGQWQGDPDAETNDVKFTLDMLETISEQYCVDMESVYATGKSNGGGFATNVLACDPIASTKIAAFAGFAGAYYQNIDESCNGAKVPIKCNPGRKPVPILDVHGTADGVIKYNGGRRRGRCLPSLPHFMTEWAKRNGLGSQNESTTMSNGKAVKYQWGQGVNTHYRVKGLGHVWPDTEANVDGCCSVVDGSKLAMEFFRKWTLKTAPRLASTATPTSSLTSSTTAATTSRTSHAHAHRLHTGWQGLRRHILP